MTLKERMVRVETELRGIKEDTTKILDLIKEQVKMKENIKSNTSDLRELTQKYDKIQSHKIAELWGIVVLFLSVVTNYIITFIKK